MQNATKQNYDYVVVGAGLSGLCIASALSQMSEKVLLVESSEVYGGVQKSVHLQNTQIDNGLRFLPATDLSQKALSFLGGLTKQDIEWTVEEAAPLTFASGILKPFLGFADRAPNFYEDIAYFLSPERLRLKEAMFSWPHKLFSQFRGDFLPKAYVTRFVCEEGQVRSLTVNGQKTITGQNFIFCGQLAELPSLFAEGAIQPKMRQKLAKAHYACAVGLDLLHSSAQSDVMNTLVLEGTTENEIGPCIGRFFQPLQPSEGQQVSQWISWLDYEDAVDTENIANTLKKMRQQIKRAFPNAFEQLSFERIFVSPPVGGDIDLKLTASQSIPGIDNLWIGSGLAHSQKNLLGSLLQAELVCSALGCHPAGVVKANLEQLL